MAAEFVTVDFHVIQLLAYLVRPGIYINKKLLIGTEIADLTVKTWGQSISSLEFFREIP